MEMGLVELYVSCLKMKYVRSAQSLVFHTTCFLPPPFPGSRSRCSTLVKLRKSTVIYWRCADAIFIEELHAADLYHKVSQAFTVFLPVRSVGVMGDGRKYDWVVSLRSRNYRLYDCSLGAPTIRLPR